MTKSTFLLAAALGLLAGTLAPQAGARITPQPTRIARDFHAHFTA